MEREGVLCAHGAGQARFQACFGHTKTSAPWQESSLPVNGAARVVQEDGKRPIWLEPV